MNRNILPAGTLFFFGFCLLNVLLSQLIVMSGSDLVYRVFYMPYGIMENQTVILYVVSIFIAGRAALNNKRGGLFWPVFIILSSFIVCVLELHIYGITELIEMVFQGLPPRPGFVEILIVSSGRLVFALLLFYGCFLSFWYKAVLIALLKDKKKRFYPFYIVLFLCLLLVALFFDFEKGRLEHIEETLEVDAAVLWLIFAFTLEDDIKEEDKNER